MKWKKISKNLRKLLILHMSDVGLLARILYCTNVNAVYRDK